MTEASPPEQLMDEIAKPSSGPSVCSSFRASRKAGTESSRAMPRRFRKASAAASEPAREAVWESVAARASAERPTFIAMTGLRRSEEHTSELQSLMRSSYAVFCLKKKNKQRKNTH